MNAFSAPPPALEEGLRPLESLGRVPPLPDDPSARARLLLLFALEAFSVSQSHASALDVFSQEDRRALALIRRVDACQCAQLAALLSPLDDGERALLYALLAVDLAAALAQRLPDGEVRRALDFALPEFQDALYRLANLLALDQKRDPQRLLGASAEIMPGRPLIACHRHPFDGLALPLPGASPRDLLSLFLMSALLDAQRGLYLASAGRAPDPLAQGLYLELFLIAEQHQGLFASLLPAQSPLGRTLAVQYAECYLYDSWAQAEENGDLRAFLTAESEHERAHMRKIADLLARDAGDSSPLPQFPPPLRLAPSKGYVRDTLAHVGVTALREGQSPVGALPRGADFFRYQRKMCPRAEAVPSHAVVAKAIRTLGADYRFEIAPHPIEVLRNRRADEIRIGR